MAKKKEEQEKVIEKVVDPTIKYRCDFKSYEEYNNYKGTKG